MQTQVKIEGQVTPCKAGHQPKHYSERFGALHFCECSPCGISTPKFSTFGEALQFWESMNGTVAA